MLEAPGFHPGRTVADHLRVRCAATGAARSRIDVVLADTGMSELARRRAEPFRWASGSGPGWPGLCSASQRYWTSRRTGWNPQVCCGLRGFLRRLGDEGRTVLVSSHLLADVAQFADRTVVSTAAAWYPPDQ